VSAKTETYVPALGLPALTRFYDLVVRLTLPEFEQKKRLADQALRELPAGARVLDLGSGTGTLTLLLKQRAPGADVAGLDGDPEVIAVARAKAQRAGFELDLRQGLSWEPPFEEGSFDRVVSSLFFHHLRTEDKRRTLAKAHDLLRPGGELHVLDWGEARSALTRLAFLPVQVLDGFGPTRDNVRGRLLPLFEEAGFASVEETGRRNTLFGTLSLYRAVRPGSASPCTGRFE
tara:strand:- start:808 stop:1503 length:696 start_codon:yes stop_codon:yes gene_type:complete